MKHEISSLSINVLVALSFDKPAVYVLHLHKMSVILLRFVSEGIGSVDLLA